MIALLDTHCFLWWTTDDPRLPAPVREIIADEENTLYFSAASGWEIATKMRLNKLSLPEAPEVYIPRRLALDGILPLSVTLTHTLRTHALPLHHKDPFDRILIAQCQVEGIPLLTCDPEIAKYSVQVLWPR